VSRDFDRNVSCEESVPHRANLLPLESIQNRFPGMYVPYKKGTYPNIWQRLAPIHE